MLESFYKDIDTSTFPAMDGNVNDLAIQNMHVLSMFEIDHSEETKTKIVEVLKSAENAIKQKICCACLFYCWFDDMANQLRFSVVPDVGIIPFRRVVVVADSLIEIVSLAFVDRSGYVLENFQGTEEEAFTFDDDIPLLKVYFKPI